jgi:hypothetical protein
MKSKFAQYAAERSKTMFLGTLIKFVKGEWQMGADRNLISPTQRFVAVMDTATTGHMKWLGGKSVDSRMGLIADEFRPVHRNELDDLDSKTWEVDENGDRVDPWQKTNLLVLVSPTAPHDLFTFSTSTEGGQSAIGDLCGAHGRTTEEAGQYPVVTLGLGGYLHKIKSRGWIKTPLFKIVDCVEASPFNAIVAEERGGAGFMPASVSSPALEPVIAERIRTEQQPVPRIESEWHASDMRGSDGIRSGKGASDGLSDDIPF